MDSRLAAIIRGNVEVYRDSSDDTINHCLALLALHHYKKNKTVRILGNRLNPGWDFSKMLHLRLLKVTLTL